MAEPKIRFEDGAGYERMMGKWSQLVGAEFVDWLAVPSGLRWVDVGCGNGAFTETIVELCAPAEVNGVDPSEGQLAFARARPASRVAKFQTGDAMSLPFADRAFDVAVMALVIFFLPDPSKGLAEMVRVVAPGGTVAAYAWDILGGGFPLDAMQAEMRKMGLTPLLPPSVAVSRMEALRELWEGSGLADIATREFTVERTFTNFEEFWEIAKLGSSVGPTLAAMSAEKVSLLKAGLSTRLAADSAGRVTVVARANAVKGRIPK
jgi:ubiquinone/menaquinone biosynthesis C-methylase UbiE